MSRIDIRAKLHNLIGHLRRNEMIDAYDLLLKMSTQMDEDYYINGPALAERYRDEFETMCLKHSLNIERRDGSNTLKLGDYKDTTVQQIWEWHVERMAEKL